MSMSLYIYTCYTYYLGKLQQPHCDLTRIMVNKGNHPQVAELFRLVKYNNLPRIFGYTNNIWIIFLPWDIQ